MFKVDRFRPNKNKKWRKLLRIISHREHFLLLTDCINKWAGFILHPSPHLGHIMATFTVWQPQIKVYKQRSEGKLGKSELERCFACFGCGPLPPAMCVRRSQVCVTSCFFYTKPSVAHRTDRPDSPLLDLICLRFATRSFSPL